MKYRQYPATKVQTGADEVWRGYDRISEQIRRIVRESGNPRFLLAVETYPGVWESELLPFIATLEATAVLDAREALCDPEEFEARIAPYLTEDRVFGRMYYGELSDFYKPQRVKAFQKAVDGRTGFTIVYGVGAAELVHPDLILYADMARWEIQLRFRKGMSNFYTGNSQEDTLRKFKRGYFFEWRVADKIKRRLLPRLELYLDTNRENDPVMITGDVLRRALKAVVTQPFRLVPYFDPGVWGGQWMKAVCGLDPEKKNYAWAFDGVPEENSLYFELDDCRVEVPALNAVLLYPRELLGDQVYARFGAEYPIRFDFLDTMEGQNLSLQVHPVTDYIHHQFGMSYTQDESYYILDAKPDACVYLGVREETRPKEMIEALRKAQSGGQPFDAERYVNRFPAKKHDHFLIPAGTIHCSGKNCMVLEISATPYIFTMKLWDWGRLGLDGKPRPIHIDHGERVIQWERRTQWVRDQLVNQLYTVRDDEQCVEEHTGLHELEFIETRRYWVREACEVDNGGGFSMCNLVEGGAAMIESTDGSFQPYEVHYAETFIIPASIERFRIRNLTGEQIGVIRAYVRTPQ